MKKKSCLKTQACVPWLIFCKWWPICILISPLNHVWVFHLPPPELSQEVYRSWEGEGRIFLFLVRHWTWRMGSMKRKKKKMTRLFQLPLNILRASQVAWLLKNLPANAGDSRHVASIPGSGRSPGVGNGNPLQYSCLENPTGRGA